MSKRKPKKVVSKAPAQTAARGYREVAGIGTSNTDWAIGIMGADADLWQNAWLLTSRMRDLFRCNPLYTKYRELLWANVFGENGILLRNKAKEMEDRVIHTPDEKIVLETYWTSTITWERYHRVARHFAKKRGETYKERSHLSMSGSNGTRKATIKVGELDVFANQLIERKWLEWQRAEYCDFRRSINYRTLQQMRMISAVTDGDCFIRIVRGKSINKFGIALQLISSEWVDRFYNTILPNGNEVRMGIEYQFTPFGIREPVAYYFIKRVPMDWQWSNPQGLFGNPQLYERVKAEDIIHYRRIVETNNTRPAPWCASTIPKARQLDQFELAEVIAARRSACKVGYVKSTMLPDGGQSYALPDPAGMRFEELAPGEIGGLPWGMEYQDVDPKHPNQNFEAFRKAMLRSDTAGMPGADYSRMANDYEAINFSAGRLQMMDTNDIYKLLQRFDIDYAERPIFEAWLNMSLLTGEIKLPVSKFEKFNQPVFQGRRWPQVDEIKSETASALRVANKMNSRQRECAASQQADWEEILFELAEENMVLEQFGMATTTTAETPMPEKDVVDDTSDDGDEPQKPKDKNRLLVP